MSEGRPSARPGSAPGQLASTQLLVDLVMNTLDPGYAAAARRRGGAAAPRRAYDRPAVVVGCLLIGLILVIAYLHTHRAAPEEAKIQNSLVARVQSAERQNAELAGQLERLNSQATTLRDRALPGSRTLIRSLSTDELAAGQVTVTGPGVQVVLAQPPAPSDSSAPARDGTAPQPVTNTLTDRDIQSVVNELWADGAEAVAVNGIRLTPTAAIRFAGQAILIDYQPIASPYTIRAIGDANVLDTSFAASAVAGRYQTLVSAEGIGFSFGEQKSMTLAASAPATLRYAHAPATPRASSGAGGR